MQIFAIGLNHHTAPLALRERLAFPTASLSAALADLTAHGLTQEAALLSTCNRTELYCTTSRPEAVAAWLANYRGLALPEISPSLYAHADREAVRHLFRVASGLDSMVLGEPQILGQLKEASRIAEQAGTLGSVLHKLLQTSFSAAKDVRSSTAIGANVVSMAAAAVQLASKIFESMSETRVLFVGAGEMIHLCARHFTRVGPARVTVANRSLHRAEALAAEIGGDAMALEGLGDALPHYDIVVSCTASPLPLIGHGMAERALRARRWRPIVMVDLAVPRDIEAEVARLSDIFLYTVDDLMQLVSTGRESRLAAVDDAEAIIAARVDAFLHWLHSREAVPTIRLLREHVEGLRQAELERARRLLAHGEDPHQVLEQLSQALSNKLLHGPIHYLNQADDALLAQTQMHIRQMFLYDSRNLSAASLSQPTKPDTDS